MINHFTKLFIFSLLAFGTAASPLKAEPASQERSRILNLLQTKEVRSEASRKSQPFSKGNFIADVSYDKRKITVTHNKETASVTFPKDSYGEIEGDFFEEEDLFFDYGAHTFHIDLLQNGKIAIDDQMAEIEAELTAAQEMFGPDAISWTSGKTKKYGYIDLAFQLSGDSESYFDSEDSLDFDLEDESPKGDYLSESSSGSFDLCLKARIIVTKKNVFTLSTFEEDEGPSLHDQFLKSFQVK